MSTPDLEAAFLFPAVGTTTHTFHYHDRLNVSWVSSYEQPYLLLYCKFSTNQTNISWPYSAIVSGFNGSTIIPLEFQDNGDICWFNLLRRQNESEGVNGPNWKYDVKADGAGDFIGLSTTVVGTGMSVAVVDSPSTFSIFRVFRVLILAGGGGLQNANIDLNSLDALPTSTAATIPNPTASPDQQGTGDPGGPGLSTGAKAGIGAGVGIAGLILIAGIVMLYTRHKKNKKLQVLNDPKHPELGDNSTSTAAHGEDRDWISPLSANSGEPTNEAGPGRDPQQLGPLAPVTELADGRKPQELDAGEVKR